MKKRVLSALTLIAMLLASCGGSEASEDTTAPASGETSVSTEPAETAEPPSLPQDYDL